VTNSKPLYQSVTNRIAETWRSGRIGPRATVVSQPAFRAVHVNSPRRRPPRLRDDPADDVVISGST
jgi:hypothetical protein